MIWIKEKNLSDLEGRPGEQPCQAGTCRSGHAATFNAPFTRGLKITASRSRLLIPRSSVKELFSCGLIRMLLWRQRGRETFSTEPLAVFQSNQISQRRPPSPAGGIVSLRKGARWMSSHCICLPPYLQFNMTWEPPKKSKKDLRVAGGHCPPTY